MSTYLQEQEGIFDPMIMEVFDVNQWPFPWQDESIQYYNSFDGCMKRFEEEFPDFYSNRETGGPMRIYHSHPLAIQLRDELRKNPKMCMERWAPTWRRRDYFGAGNPFQ